MGTKTNQTSTNTYNPASMNAYNAMQPQIQSGWSSLQSNPLSNPYVQAAYTGAMGQAGQQGQNMMSNIGQAASGGFGGMNTPGFLQAQQGQAQRATSGLQQQAFTNAMGQGAGQEASILGGMQNYQPLKTGGTQVTSQSGLGTWLPQLAGTLGGAALGAFNPMSLFGGAGQPSGQPQFPSIDTSAPAPSFQMPSQMPGGFYDASNPFTGYAASPYGGY